MMRTIIFEFIERKKNFSSLSQTDQIKYMCYFYVKSEKNDVFTPKNISDAYDLVRIPKPSNIPRSFSMLKLGKIILPWAHGCVFNSLEFRKLEEEFGEFKVTPKSTGKLFDQNLLNETRGYIEKIAEEACVCYEQGLYNACLVLLRRLMETLIIELYEKKDINNRIRTDDGNYLFFGDLVSKFISENDWVLSRNAPKAVEHIKKYGDLCAHNRRFLAKKNHIDEIRDDLELTIQEIIHLIDF